jgi:hypothetical protein
MNTTITKSQVDELIQQVAIYQKDLDAQYPDGPKFKFVKTFKEFLIDEKIEELIDQLLRREKEFKIEVLVVEAENKEVFNKCDLLLEWEQYKNIPRTNLTYRYDRGENRPGMDDHIHVFLGKSNKEVYAINRSGTPHDGSKAKLSKKEIKFLKSIGFIPPANGILEWYNLNPELTYIMYNRMLLFS